MVVVFLKHFLILPMLIYTYIVPFNKRAIQIQIKKKEI